MFQLWSESGLSSQRIRLAAVPTLLGLSSRDSGVGELGEPGGGEEVVMLLHKMPRKVCASTCFCNVPDTASENHSRR
jgi:hypothetical protein